ncbi:hypothetical protein KBZ12_14045 [Cyanobium sp. Cruz CV13-4-11]|uniref:hypothetical protein n=1 Tax=Cyanobium sp. Cruz CV13-4-11 TaxID=2823710 RepID=UPI0020CC4B70|nr:hypothetical protein [Cyanobium sp. Cruz CV13-4-11]MCP9920578.1 hypothetical protein [Cyanobium sp. Cruz CV13-4-11]
MPQRILVLALEQGVPAAAGIWVVDHHLIQPFHRQQPRPSVGMPRLAPRLR